METLDFLKNFYKKKLSILTMPAQAVLIKDFFLYVQLFVFCIYVISVSVYSLTLSKDQFTIVEYLPPPVFEFSPPPLSPTFNFESYLKSTWTIDNCIEGITEMNGKKIISLNQCSNVSMYQDLNIPLQSGILTYGTKSKGTILHEIELMERVPTMAISSISNYTRFTSNSLSISSKLNHIILNTCKSCIESNAKWCTQNCNSYISWNQIKTNTNFYTRFRITVLSQTAEIENEYANIYIT